MLLRTHYDNLKVARDAPSEVIRAAYRVLAQRYHPDVNASPEADRIMKAINEAYAILSDPQRRAEHDAWIDDQLAMESLDQTSAGDGRQGTSQYAPPPGPADPPQNTPQPPPSASPASTSEGGRGWGTILGIGALIGGAYIVWFLFLISGPSPRTESPNQPALYNAPKVTAAAPPSNGELLRLICDAHNIEGSTCSDAKGYNPGGDACDVTLHEPRAVGQFLLPGSTILLVVYSSFCEGHAMNWGGTLLFEKRGASFRFKGYQRGLTFSDCASIAAGSGRERLLCIGGHMAQGIIGEALFEVVFTQGVSGQLETSSDTLAMATDVSAAWGANQVECSSTRELFSFSTLNPGPLPNTVLVQARYANAGLIHTACAPGRTPPSDVNGRFLHDGNAWINDSEIREGQFIVNLTTRILSKVSAP
jgi:hypothetical protein